MIFNTEDNGTILTEENDNGREISLVINNDDEDRMYYIAKDAKDGFRSAGIVEYLHGVHHLIRWVGGGEWNSLGLIQGGK